MSRERLSLPVHLIYLCASLLVMMPALNLIVLWPIRPEQHAWRFGAVGVLANTLPLPTVGIALLIIAAVLGEHRNLLRFFSTVAILLSVMLFVIIAGFLLDAVETRQQVMMLEAQQAVSAGSRRTFDINTIKAALQALLAALAAAVMGGAGWRSARELRGSKSKPRRDQAPLIAGARPAPNPINPAS